MRSIQTSDKGIFTPVCEFLTHLLFKVIDSHASSARSTLSESRSLAQTLLQQLVFALVSIEDGSRLRRSSLNEFSTLNNYSFHSLEDKSNPILKKLLSSTQVLPILPWSLSTLVAGTRAIYLFRSCFYKRKDYTNSS